MNTQIARIGAAGILACALALPGLAGAQQPSSAEAQADRQATQPLNNAPVWREIRSGDPGYTSIKGRETGVLIQSAGETWRQARVPMETIGGAIVAVALLAVALFYSWRGAIGLHGRPTGRLIQRFSSVDRLAHWTMAISFVILAVTGLVLTFGKHLLLPVIGYTLFSWLANATKITHNFVGPIFTVAVPLFIAVYIRDNLPRAHDLKWLAKAGGLFDRHGGEVPSGRFNAGEKGQFWLTVCFVSMVLVVTGLVLLFPNFDQSRSTMQIANLIHMGAGLLGVALAIGHIYLGTIGVRGAYQAMRTGYVDETWAKEHHELWYDEVKAGKSRQQYADVVPADTKSQVLGGIVQQRG